MVIDLVDRHGVLFFNNAHDGIIETFHLGIGTPLAVYGARFINVWGGQGCGFLRRYRLLGTG